VLYVAALAFLWTPEVLSATGLAVWQAGVLQIMRTFLFWFFAGALLHVVEDAICGPVAFLHPTKRATVLPRLFKVGSVGEILFVIAYCAVLYLIAGRG
jgi:inner membrane protein